MLEIPNALLDHLRQAQRIAVLTGAGTSAESGVPTFRDAQTGLWAQYDPTELATPEAFARNPKLVWEWYAWRRELVSQAQPNAGHHALVTLQQQVSTFTLITQNVDGLHQRAGSSGVIELHGNLNRIKCSSTGAIVAHWKDSETVPPSCDEGRGLLRPDVVWFGESLPAEALTAALKTAQTCEVFLSIGTSSVVYPAASLPFEALHAGAVVVEINPEITPLTQQAHFSLLGRSGEILPELVKHLK